MTHYDDTDDTEDLNLSEKESWEFRIQGMGGSPMVVAVFGPLSSASLPLSIR